jgi:hypothetical protein
VYVGYKIEKKRGLKNYILSLVTTTGLGFIAALFFILFDVVGHKISCTNEDDALDDGFGLVGVFVLSVFLV